MSTYSRRVNLGQLAGAVGVVGFLGALAYTGFVIVNADPFAARRNIEPDWDRLGIHVDQARLTIYQGGEMRASASVQTMELSRDRSRLLMAHIDDGTFVTESGETYLFTTAAAEYDYNTRVLASETQTRLQGEDIDLLVPAFRYSDINEFLEVTGAVTGIFFGGEVRAEDLRMNFREDWVITGPIEWDGDAEIQEGERRRWTFTSASSRSSGNQEVHFNTFATDGEIIIRADRIERDRETENLVAIGNVRYFDREIAMTCARAEVYRNERRLILEDKVQILVKAEEDTELREIELPAYRPVNPATLGEEWTQNLTEQQEEELRTTDNLRQFPTLITANRVEYWYGEGERRANITGDPRARQDFGDGRWRILWAHSARWDGEAELLDLLSRDNQRDARVRNSLGDDFRAEFVRVSTQEGNDDLEARQVELVGRFAPD